MDILIALVIASFIIAGAYVGYHYSQDPSNFEAHSADLTLPAAAAAPPEAWTATTQAAATTVVRQ